MWQARLLFSALVLTQWTSGAGQPDANETALRQRVDRDPHSFEANHELGEWYIRRKELPRAIPYLERAYSIDPAQYNNGYDLALAYLESGRAEDSRRVVEAMLAIKDTPELHNLLGDVEAGGGHIEAAARQYETAARADPSEKNLFDLGSFLASHRGFEQARIVFEYAVGRYPKSAQLRVGLGIADYSLGRYDDAVETLCQAVDLDPTDTRALDFLGKMYDVSPAYAEQVVNRLARFVETYPQNAAANYYYALSLRKRGLGTPGNAARAEVYLKNAVRLSPRWAEAHYQLGLLYEDEDETANAVREYEAAARLDPSAAKTHYHLAGLYRRAGRTGLAEREMHAFEELKGKKPE